MDPTTTPQNYQGELPEIEVFAAGKHTAMDGSTIEFTAADVRAIAEAYNPAIGEAPITIGHPRTNAPAYGWIASLREEAGKLLARPHQVCAEFAAAWQAGRFKKRSASLFRPDQPGNPVPGQYYIRHVGFLGAAAPAVPGLRDASFAAGEGALEFADVDHWTIASIASSVARLFRGLRDRMIETDGVEAADRVLPAWPIEALSEAEATIRESARNDNKPGMAYAAAGTGTPTLDDDGGTRAPDAPAAAGASASAAPNGAGTEAGVAGPTADFAAAQADLAAREAAIAARERALRESEAKTIRTDCAEFCASLVRDGRLLPVERPAVEALLFSLRTDADSASLSFAAAGNGEATERPRAAVLEQLLASLPARVSMREISRGDASPAVEFATPAGYTVDAIQLDLYAKAKQLQLKNPELSIAQAAALAQAQS